MSPAETLLTEIGRLGIQLDVRADRLHVEAPAGTMTAELRASLAKHKPDLIDLLRARFVILAGGLVVPRAALEFALDLERRGIPLATSAVDREFIVPEDGRLTAMDRAAIARWRHHLGAIVDYRAPEVA
jgi:hypothetical protein